MFTLAVAGAFALANVASADNERVLRAVRFAPHASLTSPRSGPAIYAAQLFGPDERRNGFGHPASAFWWVVHEHTRDSKHPWRRVCEGDTVGQLSAREGTASVPIVGLNESNDLLLVADAGDPSRIAERMIEFGLASAERTLSVANPSIPEQARACAGTSPRYSEYSREQGARVEVYGCFSNGALRACPTGPVRIALGAPTLATFLDRRREAVTDDYRFVAGVVIAALLMAGAVAFRDHANALRVLRQSGGRG